MNRQTEILKLAKRVFNNSDKAHHWLSEPKRALEGRSPIELLDTEAGVFRVKEMLIRLDEGYF